MFTETPKNASQTFKQRFNKTQQAIVEEAERLGLTPGAHFKKLVDMPHVQLLAESVLKPRECLQIFRTHNDNLNAVWAEASKLIKHNLEG